MAGDVGEGFADVEQYHFVLDKQKPKGGAWASLITRARFEINPEAVYELELYGW